MKVATWHGSLSEYNDFYKMTRIRNVISAKCVFSLSDKQVCILHHVHALNTLHVIFIIFGINIALYKEHSAFYITDMVHNWTMQLCGSSSISACCNIQTHRKGHMDSEHVALSWLVCPTLLHSICHFCRGRFWWIYL